MRKVNIPMKKGDVMATNKGKRIRFYLDDLELNFSSCEINFLEKNKIFFEKLKLTKKVYSISMSEYEDYYDLLECDKIRIPVPIFREIVNIQKPESLMDFLGSIGVEVFYSTKEESNERIFPFTQPTQQDKEVSNEYFLLEEFYKINSYGYFKLWGNKSTTEKSTSLEFGWEHDPNREKENSYSVFRWDEKTSESKDDFLKLWKKYKEEDN